jgi:hypothetical protein
MIRRLLISALLVVALFFLSWMATIENTIKCKMHDVPSFCSFAKNLELPTTTLATINETITELQSHDAICNSKTLLYVDYGFMIGIYPLIALLLLQLLTVYNKSKYKYFKTLAYLQIIPFLADIAENIILFKSLDAGHLILGITFYHIIEYCKWGISILGGVFILLASINWFVNFLISFWKSRENVSY